MRKQLLSAFAIGLILCNTTGAIAGPIDANFLIESGPEWQAAMSDGRISAIPSFTDIADQYPGRASDFVVPLLTVEGDTLVEDFGGVQNALGGFKYVYPEDPDLNDKNLSYKVDPGANVKCAVCLFDFDDSRPVGLRVTKKCFNFVGPASGARLELDFPAEATNPSSIGATSIETQTGFRLSHVTDIWYISDGQPNKEVTFEINVTPEPSALSLIGLVGLLVPLRRRRRNNSLSS